MLPKGFSGFLIVGMLFKHIDKWLNKRNVLIEQKHGKIAEMTGEFRNHHFLASKAFEIVYKVILIQHCFLRSFSYFFCVFKCLRAKGCIWTQQPWNKIWRVWMSHFLVRKQLNFWVRLSVFNFVLCVQFSFTVWFSISFLFWAFFFDCLIFLMNIPRLEGLFLCILFL